MEQPLLVGNIPAPSGAVRLDRTHHLANDRRSINSNEAGPQTGKAEGVLRDLVALRAALPV
jgi:hypothetical protein